MVNFGPLTAEIRSEVWGTPANFNGFRVLASLLHRRRSMEVNQTLHNVCPSHGLVRHIYILGTVFYCWYKHNLTRQMQSGRNQQQIGVV